MFVKKGTHHFTRGPQVLSPHYGMDALHDNTLLEMNLGTHVKSWVDQKTRPDSQPNKSREHFGME